MALAHPIVLVIGGLLIAIPIVLHFLMRRKPKHIIFPALQFVRRRQSSNQRKLQLRHFLLLALRCAVIALVAIALAGLSAATNLAGAWTTIGGLGFGALVALVLLGTTLWLMRPVNWWLAGGLGVIALTLSIVTGGYTMQAVSQGKDVVISNEREPVAAVLLFDTGPQMNYRFDNQTRLEKAKEIGKWLMAQLPLESEVSICDSRAADPVFSVDISAAGKRMQALKQTFLPIPVTDQLQKCFALAQSSGKKQREVYVFTDLSVTAWREANRSAIKQIVEKDKGTHLYIIDVSAPDPANFMLGAVTIERQTGSQATAMIHTELRRLGEAGKRTIQIEIERQDPRLPARRDGKTVVPESDVVNTAEFSVGKNDNTLIDLPIADLPPGLHHGRVRIMGQDGLEVDDQRFFTIDIRDRWPVLVVSPRSVSQIDIVEILQRNKAVSLELTSINQQELAETTISDFSAVFLLDPKPLNVAQWSLLNRFVTDGGSLAIFLGSEAGDGATIDSSFKSEIAMKLLPQGLNAVWRVDDDPISLSPTEFNHSILQPMQGYATSIPWIEFPIKRFWGLDSAAVEADGLSEVILKYSNRRPAIIDQTVGRGRVILWTTPVTEPFRPDNRTRWNDLMLGGECWPTWWLLRNTTQYMLASKKERVNYVCGETAILENDPKRYPSEYQMFPPGNQEPLRVVAQDQTVVYPFVDQPGVFRLKGRGEKSVSRGFSSNLTPESTELTKISIEQLDDVLGARRYELAREEEEIQRQQGNVRQGREFYPVLILLLVLFFGFEQIMANWFYKTQ